MVPTIRRARIWEYTVILPEELGDEKPRIFHSRGEVACYLTGIKRGGVKLDSVEDVSGPRSFEEHQAMLSGLVDALRLGGAMD